VIGNAKLSTTQVRKMLTGKGNHATMLPDFRCGVGNRVYASLNTNDKKKPNMTNDEQKAIQPLLDEVNNKHRAFTMANNKRDPYCSCLPNVDVGFNVTFPNEWEVSVRWGKGHNCDGGKTTVEVAVFDTDDNWYKMDDDDKLCTNQERDSDIMGHVTPEVLLNILQEVAKQ